MSTTLFFGDCLQKMAEIPDGSVDMVLCDPPYQATRNQWDIAIPLEQLWKGIRRVCKPNAMIVFHSGGAYTAELMMSNQAEAAKNMEEEHGQCEDAQISL